jgi:hypothetical protein
MSREHLKPGSNESNRGREGRTKGSRDKLARRFIEDLYDDWVQNGAGVIRISRIEKLSDLPNHQAGFWLPGRSLSSC